MPVGKTIAQKILARTAGKESVEVGEIVDASAPATLLYVKLY